MPTRKPKTALRLETLFMASNGIVPEQYAQIFEKDNLNIWIAEGSIEHRPFEKTYTLTPEAESRLRAVTSTKSGSVIRG